MIKKNLPVKIKNINTKGKFLWFELENKNKEKIYLIDWNNFIDYVPKWAKDRNNINTIIDKLK